jgi:hypothetical protein
LGQVKQTTESFPQKLCCHSTGHFTSFVTTHPIGHGSQMQPTEAGVHKIAVAVLVFFSSLAHVGYGANPHKVLLK